MVFQFILPFSTLGNLENYWLSLIGEQETDMPPNQSRNPVKEL